MPIFGLGRKKEAVPAAPAPALPEPHELPGGGDEDYLRLLDIARSRDWDALRAEFAQLRGNDLSSLLSKVCGAVPDIGEWVPDDGGDALAQAVLGADAIERGWRVRTNKRAQHVSADQFKELHRLLRVAEEHLYASVELDGESVAPWYSLMISGRGLQIGLDTQRRRFDAAVGRCPGHLGAHRQMLQQLCRKWGGSHEQMREFATAAMRGPHGDVLGELIPQAYFEHWGDLPKDSPERGFIRSEQARAELDEAAQRTIFRPGYSFPRNPYHAANCFLWAFTRAEMWPQAKAALDATRDVVVGWGPTASDPIAQFTRLRATVLNHQ